MNYLYYWVAIILVIIIGIGYFTLNGDTPENLDTFAKCLTESGAKMYGAFWCTHCKAQKLAFGSSWEYVDYIECSTGTEEQTEYCENLGILGYPTWEFGDGSRLEGEISFDILSKKTGC